MPRPARTYRARAPADPPPERGLQSGSGSGGGHGATPSQNGGAGVGLQGGLGGVASAKPNPRFGRYLCDRLRELSSATLTAKGCGVNRTVMTSSAST